MSAKTQSPVAIRMQGSWNCDAFQLPAWIYRGGGLQLYQELLHKRGLNFVGFFTDPIPTQPLGRFDHAITDAKQLKGLKYRSVGLRNRMRCRTVPARGQLHCCGRLKRIAACLICAHCSRKRWNSAFRAQSKCYRRVLRR